MFAYASQGQEDDKLNEVDIMSDHDESSLLGFDEGEQLGNRVLVKSMGELSNSEWDLGTLVEDDFGGSSRRVRSLKFCLIVFNGLLNM